MADQEKVPMPRVVGNLPRFTGDPQQPEPVTYAQPQQREKAKAIAQALSNVEGEIKRTPLQEIAARLSMITYGEMKEYCSGTGSDPDKVWEWCTTYKPEEKSDGQPGPSPNGAA